METDVQNDMYISESSILVDNSIKRKQFVSCITQSMADFNTLGRTIEIDIPSSDSYYILSKSFIEIKVRLVRADDTAYDANAQIALINIIIRAL